MDDEVDLFVIYDDYSGKKSLDSIPERKKIEDGVYKYSVHYNGTDSLGNRGCSGWIECEVIVKDGKTETGRIESFDQGKFYIPNEDDFMMVAYKLN